MLKIGIMGAGAIGCYVGGRLAAAGGDVVFVDRARVKAELEASGLTLADLAGSAAPTVSVAPSAVRVATDAASLADRDVVLVCVKSAQTAEAGAELARVLPGAALVVSMQNGVRNADVLREALGDRAVLGGIVGFNVVSKGDGTFRRATSGPLVIEGSRDPRVATLASALRRAGFETDVRDEIRRLQWSKLVVNLNNAVSALTDAPTTRLLAEAPYRRVIAAVMAEAIGVFRRAGVRPARLGPLPVQLFPHLLRLPSAVVKVVSKLQVSVDPEARSSMWEDLARGRPTEVDQLNGEIVRLAASCGATAPLNARIVELIRAAERAGRGSPKLSGDDLWRALTAPA
jgi:2-dehydropantoate 2-reductase